MHHIREVNSSCSGPNSTCNGHDRPAPKLLVRFRFISFQQLTTMTHAASQGHLESGACHLLTLGLLPMVSVTIQRNMCVMIWSHLYLCPLLAMLDHFVPV